MAGNYLAQWYAQYRRDRVIRRALREALTAEVIFNLEVMDNSERVLRKAIEKGAAIWPDTAYSVNILSACTAPDVLGILTEAEQIKIPILFQQLTELREEFASVRAQLLTMSEDYRLNRLSTLLNRAIPYPATNLMDLLCQLLEHQDRYSSERSIQMAAKLLPTTLGWSKRAPRLWRTSDLNRAQRASSELGSTLLVWKNDAPNLVPDGVDIIEITMGEMPFGTFEHKGRRWFERAMGLLQQRRKNRAARRDVASILASRITTYDGS
jgi:hypothetical protein